MHGPVHHTEFNVGPRMSILHTLHLFTILKADGLDSNDAYGMSLFTMCLSARTQDKPVAMQADISYAA